MSVASEVYKKSADALREARDLMNHGGRHWIKGAAKMLVRPDHEPGGYGVTKAAKRLSDKARKSS